MSPLAIIGIGLAFVAAAGAYLIGHRHGSDRNTPAPFEPELELDAPVRTAALSAWMRRLLLSANSEDLFYANVAAGIVDLVPADAGATKLKMPDGERIVCVAAAGLGADEMRGMSTSVRVNNPFQSAEQAGMPIVIPLSASDPHMLRVRRMTVALVTPINDQGECVGYMVGLRTAGTFGRQSIESMAELTRWTEVGLDNAALLALAEREKERAEVTLHSIGDAVITTDHTGAIEYLNPVAEAMTGWTNIEAQSLPITDVFDVIDEGTGEPIDNPVTRCLAEGRTATIPPSAALVSREGTVYAIDDSAAPIRGDAEQIIGAVLVFHDVSRSRALARQLSWQARHDALTGLPNRRHFEDSLGLAIDSAKERRTTHILLYLDLDQFKLVNDTCGHMAGDELLKQLAQLLKPHMRPTDTLARLGGDEFGILLGGCSLEVGTQLADSLRGKVCDFRFVWEQTAFTLGVSVGLVLLDANAGTLSDVMSAADMALYAAKEQGRNRVHVYVPGDEALRERRGQMRWVSRINRALEDNRLMLYGQTIVSTRSEEFTHLEVLVRMRARDGRTVPPGAFIPAAERYNLMLDVDRWVIRAVFQAMKTRQEQHGHTPMCAINLSGASLSDDSLFMFIRDELRTHNIAPETVCFEITETAAIQNLPKVSTLISELKSAGCLFALDDFGSGLSSFAYLKALPVDYIKIDGAFVREMTRDRVSEAIVVATTQVAEALGVKTIAEFVESPELLRAVTEVGVDYAQGFEISPPRRLSDILEIPNTSEINHARPPGASHQPADTV